MDGNLTSAPRMIAQVQADYYEEKLTKLMRNLLPTNENPVRYLTRALQNWSMKDNRPIKELRCVTLGETLQAIRKLGSSKASGMDGIDAKTIKIAAEELCKPVNFLTNMSIQQRRCPAKWKLAKIVPLHKGENLDKLLPSSYRPIAIFPSISKIVERAIQVQITSHMEETLQWNTSQHAYKKGYSTTSSLLQLSDLLFQACKSKQIAVAMAIDESSAFECVNKEILLKKMSLYNFGTSVTDWIDDYLSFRSQYVQISNKKSSMKTMKQGVPQGSVMGPILFLLYTNKLPESIKEDDWSNPKHMKTNNTDRLFNSDCEDCGHINGYANDTTYVTSSKSRTDNQEKITMKLESIRTHLSANKLVINMGKMTVLETMARQKRCTIGGIPPSLNVIDENGRPKVVTAGIERDL